MLQAPETIEIKLRDYKIEGIVLIQLWGGKQATISMKPEFIKEEPLTWFDVLNDNGYGCEKILGGIISIYANYGPNYLVYQGELLVGQYEKDYIEEVLYGTVE